VLAVHADVVERCDRVRRPLLWRESTARRFDACFELLLRNLQADARLSYHSFSACFHALKPKDNSGLRIVPSEDKYFQI
jgi:hypothetical protein